MLWHRAQNYNRKPDGGYQSRSLGKLITYASGKGADILIWIVKHAIEEHRAAIERLNNHTDENISFFLIEIRLHRIDNSDLTVKFEIIEKPNNWTKEVKK